MGQTAECSQQYRVPAKVLYQVFLDEKDLTRLHWGSKANMAQAVVGNQVDFMDKNISGTILDLQENGLIFYKLRFAEWKEGEYSTVTFKFIPLEEELTEIAIKQSNIPEYDKFGNSLDADNYKEGWKRHFLEALTVVFGFPKA